MTIRSFAVSVCLLASVILPSVKAQSTGYFDGSHFAGIAAFRTQIATFFVYPGLGYTNTVAVPFDLELEPTPLSADFDADGVSDLALWFQDVNGVYLLAFLPSNSLQWQFFEAGQAGDIPLVGEFDSSKFAGFGVWRPSNQTFYIWPGKDNAYTQQLGQAGDIPMLGDFDGDGVADLTVYRPSTHAFYFIKSSDHTTGSFAIPSGQAGDIPLIADFDNSGKTGVAVWRVSNSAFYVYPATAAASSYQLGQPGDVPLTADFDGDGKSDIGVWRPSNGVLYYVKSSDGSHIQFPVGEQGDVPMPTQPGVMETTSTLVTISGKTSTPAGAALANQTVFLLGAGSNASSVSSASDGSYSFSVQAGGAYSVATNGLFPLYYSYSNIQSNQTANFQSAPQGLEKLTVFVNGQPYASLVP